MFGYEDDQRERITELESKLRKAEYANKLYQLELTRYNEMIELAKIGDWSQVIHKFKMILEVEEL